MRKFSYIKYYTTKRRISQYKIAKIANTAKHKCGSKSKVAAYDFK